MQVLVLHNDATSGRIDDVDTLQQLTEITALLHQLGHQVSSASCQHLTDIERSLNAHQPDIIFNLVESFGNSDASTYLVKAYLESHGIPCTGCSAESLFLSGNKLLAKRLMGFENIPTPALGTDKDAQQNSRYIVKSASEHASFGLDAHSIVDSLVKAQELIQRKKTQYGGEWFAETYIEGREINLALLQKNNEIQCLPPTEIYFENAQDNIRIVDYAAKWHVDSDAYRDTTRHFVSSTTDSTLIKKLETIAKLCWNVFGLTGYARVDFRVDAEENPWVLEVNANPCLSADAGFMAAAQHAGLTPLNVIEQLLGNSLHDSRFTTKTLSHA